ncbi:MAG: type II secretion system protein [Candidatus Acidiferrum sp.]
MRPRRGFRFNQQSGFTLIELMISLLILGLVTGAVFSQMGGAQQHMNAEQVKLDNFQEARDFVDQFFRDVNQIGDPNPRMFDLTGGSWSPGLASPLINDRRLAVGLVKIDSNYIQFEGSVNGLGTVQSVIYSINGSGSCTLCLQRSQVDKVSANPLTGQATNWGTEVNDVASSPIFLYYDTNGTQITTLPKDINSDPATIASVKTIKLSLTIRNPQVIDQKTGQPIETSFEGEVSLNNCSMAATGQGMSCE